MIPDELARELWVALARHMDRPRDLEVTHDDLMAVLAKHLDPSPAADCEDHKPVQHRDRKRPWCNRCGRAADGELIGQPR